MEILGVLKKHRAEAGHDSGSPVGWTAGAKTGVIAGMSGSPVYIDGRLVGAVAFAFPFAKEPIAGIQPIQQMLNLLESYGSNTACARRRRQ